MSDRTWEDIGNEIRDDYLRDDCPENVSFREVQWEVWIAEVRREAAEKAWDRAEGAFEEAHNADMLEPWPHMRDNPYRAEAYRQEREEQ